MTPALIPAADWPTFATRVAAQIQKMADGSGGRYSALDIELAILCDQVQVWAAIDDDDIVWVLLLTQIIDYPQFKAIRAIGCVGAEPRRWLKFWDFVETQAKGWGCSRVEALHPEKWPLSSLGWSVFHILSERPL